MISFVIHNADEKSPTNYIIIGTAAVVKCMVYERHIFKCLFNFSTPKTRPMTRESRCGEIPNLLSYPGYFRERHWKSMVQYELYYLICIYLQPLIH